MMVMFLVLLLSLCLLLSWAIALWYVIMHVSMFLV